jgi:hypothetical protein
MIFPKRNVFVIAVSLLANGTSSYRDSNSITKITEERWNAKTIILTDNVKHIKSDAKIKVSNKSDFLTKLESIIKENSKKYDILFTLSAHGYSSGRHQYIRINRERVMDYEIRDSFYKYMDESCLSLCLVDTCHSGSMFDLPWHTTNGTDYRYIKQDMVSKLQSYCISACNDRELAGEDISDYGGWGGKLISQFLDHFDDKIDIIKLYKYIYKTFSTQKSQRSHPILSMTKKF